MPPKRLPMCFVIMPFIKARKKVYTDAIRPACKKAGFRVVRVDEDKGPFNITRKIINYLYESEVVVADLSGHNPNVFYEMGVAHAIANKTIMIVEQDEKLPFDIQSYNCIFYKKTVKGFEKLEKGLIESLQHLDEWRTSPCNPVQDFKPKGGELSQVDQRKLQKALAELKAADKRLKTAEAELDKSVPKLELEAAKKQLREQKKSLVSLEELQSAKAERDQLATDLARLQKEVKQLRSRQQNVVKVTKPSGQQRLRSEPTRLSVADATRMVKDRGFFHSGWNQKPGRIEHDYQVSDSAGTTVVTDASTGLMWQQGGSSKGMGFEAAKQYIQQLNKDAHAGFSDWRLPTLEEAMSLMESKKNKSGLFVAALFEQEQRYIWTADKESASRAWNVGFHHGYCGRNHVDVSYYVRAVR